MRPEQALNIKGRCAEAIRHGSDFRGSSEKKNSAGINEPANKPGAGGAIYLGARPRDPKRMALRKARRHMLRLNERQLGGRPRLKSALKLFGGNASMTEPSGHALAQLQALLA